MTRQSWSQVNLTGAEMRLFILTLQNNNLTSRDFTGKELLRMFAYRRAVKAGLFTDQIKEKVA